MDSKDQNNVESATNEELSSASNSSEVTDVAEDTSTPLDYRDHKNLSKNKYDEVRKKFKNVYVLRHRSGKVAELNAASPLHACKLIGWRPRHVKVVRTENPETSKE